MGLASALLTGMARPRSGKKQTNMRLLPHTRSVLDRMVKVQFLDRIPHLLDQITADWELRAAYSSQEDSTVPWRLKGVLGYAFDAKKALSALRQLLDAETAAHERGRSALQEVDGEYRQLQRLLCGLLR
jgi:hypothetical protein